MVFDFFGWDFVDDCVGFYVMGDYGFGVNYCFVVDC